MKDKLILIYYINVKGLSSLEAAEKRMRFSQTLRLDGVIQQFIPITDGVTKVECINPILCEEKTYSEIKERLERISKELDKQEEIY